MTAKEKFVPVQLLENVHRELNGELSPALEILNGKLRHGFKNPQSREGDIFREYAELREARTIVFHLKHPDRAENAPVRLGELAWALKLARKTCETEGHIAELALFDKAADILGIELTHDHDLPNDLHRKIKNELQLLGVEVQEEVPEALKVAEAA
jgi:hypothetical protein